MNLTIMTELTPQNTRRIAAFTIGMAFLAWMAVKLPMPALPTLGKYFHTSSQVFKVSVTLNLLAFSLSQLFWGTLSDRFGRKIPLIIAFSLSIVGTLFAMLAQNIGMYLTGRIIEGFAVGSAAPIGRAIMADKLDKITMAKIYAWYAIAALLPPAVGPIIGGYLLVFIGWRSIFAFYIILAVIYVIACMLWFQETHENTLKKIRIHTILKDLSTMVHSSSFWSYMLTYALINGFMIAYYAAMPFWYVVHFHLGESTYAWLAFLPIASYILGSSLASRLLAKFPMDRLLIMGIYFAILIALTILLVGCFTTPTLISLNIFMTLFSVASGVVTPMTNANLMHLFRDKISALSALLSGLRVGGAGLLVLISTNIPLAHYWPLGIYTLSLSVVALLCFIGLRQSKHAKT